MVLAPFYSAIVRMPARAGFTYFILGQRPYGGTTLRTIEPGGVHANLGEGPEPSLAAFLAALEERITGGQARRARTLPIGQRPGWGESPGLWEREGSLRDVVIQNTDRSDWAALLRLCAEYPCSYRFDGEPAVLPTLTDLLEDRSGSHCLTVEIGRTTANCHFASVDELELDLDPREVEGPEAQEAILEFVERLAKRTGKRTMVTGESDREAIYLAFDPAVGRWSV